MDELRAAMLWLHLVAAVLAVGGVAFLRLILMPVVAKEGCEHAPALSGKVRARFRKLIWHSIGLLTVTGFVMLWLLVRRESSSTEVPILGAVSVTGASRWEALSSASRHLLEAKILLAVVLFTIALILTLPAQPSDTLKQRTPALLLVNFVLGVLIFLLVAIRHVL